MNHMWIVLTIISFWYLLSVSIQFKRPCKNNIFGFFSLLGLFCWALLNLIGPSIEFSYFTHEQYSQMCKLLFIFSFLSHVLVNVLSDSSKAAMRIANKIPIIAILLGLVVQSRYLIIAEVGAVLILFYLLYYNRIAFRLTFRTYFYFWLFYMCYLIANNMHFENISLASFIIASVFYYKVVGQFMVKSYFEKNINGELRA